MQPLISIIIPVYNVEKYLEKCLNTVKNQTFKDFEALIINDGTPDNSMKIAEKFVNEDKRFIFFNKPNGGLSDARNFGLERAKGEFVVFIDSDDYVDKDYLKVMYEGCINNNADMAYCRFKHYYPRTGIKVISLNPKKGVYDRDKALDMLIRDNLMHSYAWNKIYRKSLFIDNDIRYPKMYFEDVATSIRLLCNANRIVVSDKYLYFYVRHPGSIMSTMNAKKINDLILSLLINRNYIQYSGDYDKFEKSIKAVAKKMQLVNIYSIFRQHILCFNFEGCLTNLRTNNKMYKYVTSKTYKAIKELPELPFTIIQPENKKKKK